MDELRLITKEIFYAFGGRKHEGILSVIIDVRSGKVFLVPHTMEHISAACELLGVSKKQLEANPLLAQDLVPVNILVRDDLVVGVLNGRSGMEMGYKVTHPKQSLDRAHVLIWDIIAKSANKGGIGIGQIEIDKIFYPR